MWAVKLETFLVAATRTEGGVYSSRFIHSRGLYSNAYDTVLQLKRLQSMCVPINTQRLHMFDALLALLPNAATPKCE